MATNSLSGNGNGDPRTLDPRKTGTLDRGVLTYKRNTRVYSINVSTEIRNAILKHGNDEIRQHSQPTPQNPST
jgi:hypothetical protein